MSTRRQSAATNFRHSPPRSSAEPASSGGIGRPADTAAAILVIAVITNVMTILNYQYPVQLLVQGIVLTGAVAFYSWQRGRS